MKRVADVVASTPVLRTDGLVLALRVALRAALAALKQVNVRIESLPHLGSACQTVLYILPHFHVLRRRAITLQDFHDLLVFQVICWVTPPIQACVVNIRARERSTLKERHEVRCSRRLTVGGMLIHDVVVSGVPCKIAPEVLRLDVIFLRTQL